MIETIQLAIGEMTFDAIAAGPADGRLVLLLHGFPETAQSLRQQVQALGDAGYRAVAPNQRGYSVGARPTAVSAYAADHLVADVIAIADELGGHRFDLVGHDWGGAVAWMVAGRYPDRVRSLVALSTPHPHAFRRAVTEGSGDQAQKSGYMAVFRQEGVAEETLLGNDAAVLRGLYGASGIDEADAEAYVCHFTEPGALTAALNWYRAIDLGDPGAIGPITVPTMYVWSTDDVALGREAAEATADFVEGPYRFEVMEGVGHFLAEQRPDETNALLLEHLASTA